MPIGVVPSTAIPTRLLTIAVPAAAPETSMPAPRLPETTLPYPLPGKPICVFEAPSTTIPAPPLASGARPEESVPIRLPRMKVPSADLLPAWITIPFPELPEITLAWPAGPPIVLDAEALTVIPVPLGLAWPPAAVTPR